MTWHKDDRPRCAWAAHDPLLARYHDEEWGRPERDSRALWEKLMLDGFQAGLSWRTILAKRPAFRRAFARFRPKAVAAFGPTQVEALLQNEGIVRSRSKIQAVIHNAQAYETMRRNKEDFATFVWSFVNNTPLIGDGKALLTKSALSTTLSGVLKQRGFSFVGPTIVYAWMQAVGIIDDHHHKCHLYRARKKA